MPHADDPLTLLSEREREVFYFLVAGYRQNEIAGLLNLSPKTVDTHRVHLMRKLGINDLAGLPLNIKKAGAALRINPHLADAIGRRRKK